MVTRDVFQLELEKRSVVQAEVDSVTGGVGFLVGATHVDVATKDLLERVNVFSFMTKAQIEDVQSRAGLMDVSDAVNAAISYANSAKKQTFAPAGIYLISKTINVGSGALIGEGRWSEGSSAASTQFICGVPNITMVSIGSLGGLYDVSVHGKNIAKTGVLCDGVRLQLNNIEVYRCKKANYLLAKTQNSCFVNCFAQYCANGFVLANGARNNNFYNCTAANFEQYYDAVAIGVPWQNTAAITFVIDEGDSDYGGAGVTTLGQDRNNWFGGIFEQFGAGIVGKNLSGFAGVQAANNQFYGVEIACAKIVGADSGSVGTLLLDSGAYFTSSQDAPFSSGSLGSITFKGEPYFSGGSNLDNRGITLGSNYSSLFLIDTDNLYSGHSVNGVSVVSYDSVTHEFTVTGGGASDGVSPSVSARGNIGTLASTIRVGRPVGFSAQLTFTIKNITGPNPVLVYIPLNGSPWRRQVFSANAAGTYTVPVHLGDNAQDMFGVFFANNGNTSFVLKSVVMRASSNF